MVKVRAYISFKSLFFGQNIVTVSSWSVALEIDFIQVTKIIPGPTYEI